MHPFPSESWIDAYRDALNACADYRQAAKDWHHGAIALVVKPGPDLPEGFATWLDLDGGACQGARAVTLTEAEQAPFCITATYAQWRDILERRLDPIAGMLTRKIALRGNLVTMLRYVRSSQAMVACATTVPTWFAGGSAPHIPPNASLRSAARVGSAPPLPPPGGNS